MPTQPMFLREQALVDENNKATFFFFQWLAGLLQNGGNVTDYIAAGLAAARPATPPSGTGPSIWYSTDTNSLDVWTGTAWVTKLNMVYPASGIPVSTGTAWTTSKAAPSGVIVGDTDTQTLTNKTLTVPVLSMSTPSTTGQLGRSGTDKPLYHDGSGSVALLRAVSGGILDNSNVLDITNDPPSTASAIGFRGVPLVLKTTSFTLDLSHMGKIIYIGDTGLTITLPPYSSVALPTGFQVFVSVQSGWTCAIARGSGVEAYKTGSNTDTDATVPIRGYATLTKVDTDRWIMAGVT